MQLVPPTHEQTPIRCSVCHERRVVFLRVRNASTNVDDYVPERCACGHIEDARTLPPGTLFGAEGDGIKTYHPFNRPN